MKQADLRPVVLKAKEGLALTNGTQFMTAIGVLALFDSERLAKVADIAGAMSLEAMRGRSDAFVEQVHRLRNYEGQKNSAQNIRSLIHKSKLIDSAQIMKRRMPPGKKKEIKGEKLPKLQDSYSLRCMPQVHGA